MRAPRLKGLQFWAVIRALLENCRAFGICEACAENTLYTMNDDILFTGDVLCGAD